MDIVSLGFLLLILVVSGFIAFAADKLGKKLGKKRLSILGLRPRHVAALGTVLLGVVVSLLTIAFVALVSSDARQWLVEGRGLLIQRDKLLKDVTRVDNARKASEAESTRLENSIGLMKSKIEEGEARQKKLRDQNHDLENLRDELNQKVKAQSDEVRRSLALQRQTQSALDESRVDLAKQSVTIFAANFELAKLNAERAALDKLIDVGAQNYRVLNKVKNEAQMKSLELLTQNLALEKDVAERQEKVADLEKKTKDLAVLTSEAESKLNYSQSKLAEVETQLDKAGQLLVALQQRTESQQEFLSKAVRASRQEPMTFQMGEELSRVEIAPGSDVGAAQNALTTLLRMARVSAELKGARGRKQDSQTFEVADIFDRQDPQTGFSIPSDTLKRRIVTNAVGKVEEQIMIATSSLNAFRGEPVSLEVAVMPNPLIYRRNEMISETRINANLANHDVVNAISPCVGVKVRDQAKRDRMIPRAQTAAPFGEVSTDDFLALYNEIKRAGRVVRVEALAADDIHAGDPLRLEFRVK